MDDAHLVQVLVQGVASVGIYAHQAVGPVSKPVGVTPFAPGVVGQALDDAAVFIGNGGDGAQVVLLVVAHLGGAFAGVSGRAADARAAANDGQRKGDAGRLQVVPLLRDAVGFDFLLVEQAVVVPMQVPGGTPRHVAGRIAGERDNLLDPLVLGAVGEVQCAVGGGGGGAVALRPAVGARQAVAAGALIGI